MSSRYKTIRINRVSSQKEKNLNAVCASCALELGICFSTHSFAVSKKFVLHPVLLMSHLF